MIGILKMIADFKIVQMNCEKNIFDFFCKINGGLHRTLWNENLV